VRVAVFGATSAIAEQCARLWAARGARLVLVGRHAARLQATAADLALRGAAQAETLVADFDRLEALPDVVDQALATLGGGFDIALVAHGTLPDQAACERALDATLAALVTNGSSAVGLLHALALAAEHQLDGGGPAPALAVISSVAGDRGRQSNTTYGAAKALVSAYASGLGQRLAKRGIAVVLIKPGFVDTPMTAAFDKRGPLWASAERVARAIVAAIDARRPLVYVPGFWWAIMTIIRAIPERLFRRLSL
jgi:short-subunit dehydrogenase